MPPALYLCEPQRRWGRECAQHICAGGLLHKNHPKVAPTRVRQKKFLGCIVCINVNMKEKAEMASLRIRHPPKYTALLFLLYQGKHFAKAATGFILCDFNNTPWGRLFSIHQKIFSADLLGSCTVCLWISWCSKTLHDLLKVTHPVQADDKPILDAADCLCPSQIHMLKS